METKLAAFDIFAFVRTRHVRLEPLIFSHVRAPCVQVLHPTHARMCAVRACV